VSEPSQTKSGQPHEGNDGGDDPVLLAINDRRSIIFEVEVVDPRLEERVVVLERPRQDLPTGTRDP